MVDDFKILKEKLVKTILSNVSSGDEQMRNDRIDSLIRDAVIGAFERAGKSKDEIIRLLGREIGFALAAVLKEPFSQLTENKKLQITVELTPKDTTNSGQPKNTSKPSKPTKKKPSSAKKSNR